MAFHVACPITCRRICFCSLGFPRKLQSEGQKSEFLEDVARVECFLRDPWLLRVKEAATLQVAVPKVVPIPPPPAAASAVAVAGDGTDAEELFSAQTKRAAIQRKAMAASLVAEDYARRFESGDLMGVSKELPGEEQGLSNVKVMCRLCFSGENEGSERARKMLSCKSCGKKYHRSCLKTWSHHRDLFYWSSWTCPACRICEVCRRTGDPNKLMFCKRCEGAYHCYCQQPPHKNVSHGPYLCPKHTRCHSCGSTVPGNGLSVRWFLGYTCCDACGRLFVKGNYCPVCLKVYRDSESTPMVCCDVCQRWVHCQCDGISEEKYLQFQVDGNLRYKCATCRGECYEVRDLQDAVHELWRRRDEADLDLTTSLRAAAGLPTNEDIFYISPYSDDEDDVPVASKNEYSRSLKFSVKGLVDKSPKKSKDSGKKSSSKKYGKKKDNPTYGTGKMEPDNMLEGHSDAQSSGYIAGNFKDDDIQSRISGDHDMLRYPTVGSSGEGVCSINQIKNSRLHGLDSGEESGKPNNKSKAAKGPKLVIHLGAKNRNVSNSPRSDASNYQRDQEIANSNGSGDVGQQRVNERHLDRRNAIAEVSDARVGESTDLSEQVQGSKLKEGNLIKLRKLNPEAPDLNPIRIGVRGEKWATPKFADNRAGVSTAPNVDSKVRTLISQNLQKDPKPLLKLKFKNPYPENQSSWAPPGEEEKSSIKGQRSKRKRLSCFVDKMSAMADEEPSGTHEDDKMDEIMDANWIIQRLGKDAIGKRVEVYQPSNNSWHKGTLSEVMEGTLIVTVALDEGNAKNVNLGKQGIRFVSQKRKR